ncbi:helix-hairpin-helix domain-containing protein [Actinospica robiniae]|uniref:helix-hairpin-helix domain-containing protein n=1 Tax=Actinospica robiniae TaxID=304901 RepID=UPI0003FA0F41|nr:helix-hairpin-helix domain-containing protein [Actinospica robiniae]
MSEQGGTRDEAPLGPEVSRWLAEQGAPAGFARSLRAELGAQADQLLAENPWLVLEFPQVRPESADELARGLLGLAGRDEVAADPRRGRALVGWLLARAARRGDTAVGADTVVQELKGLGVPDPVGAVADAVEQGAALVFADRVAIRAAQEQAEREQDDDEDADFEALDAGDDDDPAAMLAGPYTLLALDQWAFLEQSAAEAAQRLLATATPLDGEAVAVAAVEAVPGGQATIERVRRVVEAVAEQGLTLVTGGSALLPGQVAAAFPGAVLASPSPAGLRTLAEEGFAALDLRALAEQVDRYAEAPVIVLADAQLIPLELGANLLELLPDGAHVALCGDPATLPAAGPGRLLRDLLEIDDPEFGGAVPRVELKARPSGPLTALVDAVRYGGLPPMELLGDGQSTEVKIIPVRDPGETRLRTVQLVTDSIPRALDLRGAQIQVVALRERGPASAEDLNAALKERVNPGPGVCAGLDTGDRVVVREGAGLAGFGLRGGETGIVSAADAQGLTVRFDPPHGVAPDEPDGPDVVEVEDGPGEPLELSFDAAQAGNLRHAWVLTLREAQGGHWPAVVAVIDGGSAAALTRAAVLGAFVPALSHLSVVHGAGRALAEAVEKRPHSPSRTRLAQALNS